METYIWKSKDKWLNNIIQRDRDKNCWRKNKINSKFEKQSDKGEPWGYYWCSFNIKLKIKVDLNWSVTHKPWVNCKSVRNIFYCRNWNHDFVYSDDDISVSFISWNYAESQIGNRERNRIKHQSIWTKKSKVSWKSSKRSFKNGFFSWCNYYKVSDQRSLFKPTSDTKGYCCECENSRHSL